VVGLSGAGFAIRRIKTHLLKDLVSEDIPSGPDGEDPEPG
jgi:hypothetical protein